MKGEKLMRPKRFVFNLAYTMYKLKIKAYEYQEKSFDLKNKIKAKKSTRIIEEI